MRYLEDGYWVETVGRATRAECDHCGHGVVRGSYYGARQAMLAHISREHETGSHRYIPPEPEASTEGMPF